MSQMQDGVNNGDDLATAIELQLTYATCAPPSISQAGFGFDPAQQGRAYTVMGCDTRSGIPERLLGEVGRLTGRYVVPAGCSRRAARWEAKTAGGVYLWVGVDQ